MARAQGEALIKECPLCKGQVSEKVIDHTQRYRGELFLVDNVPALVCHQCHEVFLLPETVQRIQEVIRSRKPKGVRPLPYYDLLAVG